MASNTFIPLFRNENGKRERMDQEDDPDVLPLSKRMNNIHFDGGVHSMESLSHSSSQTHGSYNVQNGFTHLHLDQSFSHSQTGPSGPEIANGDLRRNDNQLSNYSNGIVGGQGPNGYSNIANGMNEYIDNHVDVQGTNRNFEERRHDLNGQVPPLNKIAYSPTLDQQSNPFYYEQNRILFELYKERLERNNLPAHPNYGPT